MSELVALDMALGPTLIDRIRHAHDRDHAVCIIDQRLPESRRREIVATYAPTRIVTDDGEETKWDGRPCESGDGLVVATSGSSGAPKAAVLTWRAVIASAEMTSHELYRGRPTVWNACLPPAHVGGFAVLARSIFTDDLVIFGNAHELESGPKEGATHVAVVATQLHRHDLAGYRVVLLGGSRPPESVPDNVVSTWGMTETGSGIVYNGWPLDGVEVASVDGELYVKSPTLLRAYRDGTSALVVGPDGRGDWFATGDAGDVVDGRVVVRGRLGYVINTGGEKVWPDDVESVIGGLDGVDDVAVAGVDDPEWGQRVVALVVSDRPSAALFEQIAGAVGERLGPWARPRQIRSVDEIPRTGNGKIRRDVVAELAQLTAPEA
jgi:O-succinylbenzoic acid--CoA ligase